MIKIPLRTIKVQGRKGSCRLSPDLASLATYFACTVDKKKKRLILDGNEGVSTGTRLKAWGSKRGTSKTLSLQSVLAEGLGLNLMKLRGTEWNAKVQGKKIVVQL